MDLVLFTQRVAKRDHDFLVAPRPALEGCNQGPPWRKIAEISLDFLHQ